jgi:membrane protein DedA with SNARE-associated domain
MNELLNYLSDLPAQFPGLGSWSYLLLAAMTAVEGPIATLVGAAAASTGLMHPVGVFAAAASGNMAADIVWYSLGYAGRVEWLLKYGRRLGLRRRHLNSLKQDIHDHSTRLLILAKLTAGLVIPTLIAAGLAKVPWRKWLPALSVAETIWTGSLVLIGYYATQAIQQVELGIEYVAGASALVFVLLAIFWLQRVLRRRLQAEQAALMNQPES